MPPQRRWAHNGQYRRNSPVVAVAPALPPTAHAITAQPSKPPEAWWKLVALLLIPFLTTIFLFLPNHHKPSTPDRDPLFGNRLCYVYASLHRRSHPYPIPSLYTLLDLSSSATPTQIFDSRHNQRTARDPRPGTSVPWVQKRLRAEALTRDEVEMEDTFLKDEAASILLDAEVRREYWTFFMDGNGSWREDMVREVCGGRKA